MTTALRPHLQLNLHDQRGLPAFFPLLQKGVYIEIDSGVTVRRILEQYCAGGNGYILRRIQTIFLNGKPVDDTDAAILKDGDCLALSAAMPGLVGATMRSGGLLPDFAKPSPTDPKPLPTLLPPRMGRLSCASSCSTC